MEKRIAAVCFVVVVVFSSLLLLLLYNGAVAVAVNEPFVCSLFLLLMSNGQLCSLDLEAEAENEPSLKLSSSSSFSCIPTVC